MSLIAKLIISLVIAVVAYTLSSILFTGTVQLTGGAFDLRLLLAFALATIATALVVRDSSAGAAPGKRPANDPDNAPGGAPLQGERESGQVKWFNVSKGFGFIIKDDGEEIFVHFRSIRGEGRRSLRDGQRVTFIVAESDKGPQAEDVMAED